MSVLYWRHRQYFSDPADYEDPLMKPQQGQLQSNLKKCLIVPRSTKAQITEKCFIVPRSTKAQSTKKYLIVPRSSKAQSSEKCLKVELSSDDTDNAPQSSC